LLFKLPIDDALLTQNFAKIECFFVADTKMYNNREVYLCNVILATEIFCYRYSTVNNSAQK